MDTSVVNLPIADMFLWDGLTSVELGIKDKFWLCSMPLFDCEIQSITSVLMVDPRMRDSKAALGGPYFTLGASTVRSIYTSMFSFFWTISVREFSHFPEPWSLPSDIVLFGCVLEESFKRLPAY